MNPIVLMFFIVFMGLFMKGQDLSQHKWQHRLIVIVSASENNQDFKTQLAVFTADSKGCNDRKLMIYTVLPTRYSVHIAPLNQDRSFMMGDTLYKKFHKKNQPFTVYLLGLDGGIKMKSNVPWSLKTIFDTIDAMPMRMSENGK